MYMVPFNSNFLDDYDFSSPFKNLFKNLDFRPGTQNFMTTDVIESKDGLKLIMDLPGLKKENIKIELNKGYLTVTAESNKESEEKDKEGNYLRKERYSGTYNRSFYVGENITEEDIKAKFEDGALTLNFPKNQDKIEAQKKFISIEG